jgi:hypothetical protein
MVALCLMSLIFCYKACSNSSEFSTIILENDACIGARACMMLSGHSTVSNSSCVGPKACQKMNNSTCSCAFLLVVAQ